jgi:hypothetical protein
MLFIILFMSKSWNVVLSRVILWHLVKSVFFFFFFLPPALSKQIRLTDEIGLHFVMVCITARTKQVFTVLLNVSYS